MPSFVQLGGSYWSPELVGWGSPGRTPNRELLGYSPKKASRGKLSNAQRALLTVELWNIEAVYALYSGRRLLYIGEGVLGDRLLRHYRVDALAGLWNTFSFLSPWAYCVPTSAGQKATLTPWAPSQALSIPGKALVELLELVSIRLGNPPENSQLPSADKQVTWLQQVRSAYAPATVPEMLSQLLDIAKKGSPA